MFLKKNIQPFQNIQNYFNMKKRRKELPEISTASLPDIIFILLFFFMVTTVMRKNNLMLDKPDTPEASELTKIKYKEAATEIYIGFPKKEHEDKYGSSPKIQLDDAIRDKTAIQAFIKKNQAEVPTNLLGQFVVSFRVDKEVTMGIVSDVKQELRKADALKINYSSKFKPEETK